MQAITLVHVTGMGLYTFEAYKELRLQMSTGDFHVHKHEIQECDPSLEYVDIDENGEFFVVNEESLEPVDIDFDEQDRSAYDSERISISKLK